MFVLDSDGEFCLLPGEQFSQKDAHNFHREKLNRPQLLLLIYILIIATHQLLHLKIQTYVCASESVTRLLNEVEGSPARKGVLVFPCVYVLGAS